MIQTTKSGKDFDIFLSDGNSLQVFVSYTEIEESERNDDENWIDTHAEHISHEAFKWNEDGSKELELTEQDKEIVKKFIEQEAEDCFESGVYEFEYTI